MAFEGLTRAWSSERILHRDPAWAVVDKPAGVGLEDVGGEPHEGSLPARLFVHGTGRARVVLGPPERASGATLVAFAPGEATPAAGPAAGGAQPGAKPQGGSAVEKATSEIMGDIDWDDEDDKPKGGDGGTAPASGADGG